jgi:hypothetical protein
MPASSASTAAATGEPSFGDADEAQNGNHPQDKTISHDCLSS